MPIEYRCQQCDKLLRVADAAAGKKGKCPHCGAVGDIPMSSSAASTSPPPADPFAGIGRGATSDKDNPFAGAASANSAARESAGNPFADAAAGTSSAAWGGPAANSYVSPAGTAPDYSAKPVIGGAITPTRVELNELFSRTWQIYSPQMGQGVLFALLIIGIGIAGQVVAQPLAFAQQMMQDQLVAVVLLMIAQQVCGFLVQVFNTCITILFALNLARSKQSPFDGIFSIGRHFLPLLAQQFLITLISISIMAVCMIPVGLAALSRQPEVIVIAAIICICIGAVFVAVVQMVFFLSGYLLIDRRMGVIQAMTTSKEYMMGNKLTVFLTMLIAGILGTLFVVFTCCIGVLFYVPYLALLGAIVYLSATGQFATGQMTVTGQYR